MSECLRLRTGITRWELKVPFPGNGSDVPIEVSVTIVSSIHAPLSRTPRASQGGCVLGPTIWAYTQSSTVSDELYLYAALLNGCPCRAYCLSRPRLERASASTASQQISPHTGC